MNIEGAEINFDCPNCDFVNTATISEVVNGASIICVGCLETIQLVDGDSETKRAVDEIDQTVNDLRGIFK